MLFHSQPLSYSQHTMAPCDIGTCLLGVGRRNTVGRVLSHGIFDNSLLVGTPAGIMAPTTAVNLHTLRLRYDRSEGVRATTVLRHSDTENEGLLPTIYRYCVAAPSDTLFHALPPTAASPRTALRSTLAFCTAANKPSLIRRLVRGSALEEISEERGRGIGGRLDI